METRMIDPAIQAVLAGQSESPMPDTHRIVLTIDKDSEHESLYLDGQLVAHSDTLYAADVVRLLEQIGVEARIIVGTAREIEVLLQGGHAPETKQEQLGLW